MLLSPEPTATIRMIPPPKMVERPRVAVVMPIYGPMAHRAAVLGWMASSTRREMPEHLVVDAVMPVTAENSITQHCFNNLLGVVLDARDRGEVTHIAMIHSDVDPLGAPWINLLWREMLEHDLDLVSAAIPIKSHEGITSTAIAPIDDPWGFTRHIRLEERGTLPTTFTGADVCGPGELLMVNTGLWLADLRRPWWDDFAFQVHTRLVVRNGKRVPQMRSEDWEMSRHLHRHGARYGATWAVELRHWGHTAWDSHQDA